MDEQVSWKGQSFTLLVFGGIVFLCSIFFVLGMLVGRGQGERAADQAAASADAKNSTSVARAQDSTHTLAPYESITTGKEVNKETSKETSKETGKESGKEISKEAKLEVPRDVEPPKASPTVADKPKPASKVVATPAPAPSKAVPAKPPSPVKMIYLQVTALEKDSAATKQAETLRKAGFPAVVMVGGDGRSTLYKVQVGPFDTVAEADTAKRKLEALGYKPIRK